LRGIYIYVIGGPLLIVRLEIALLSKAAIVEYRVVFQDTYHTDFNFSYGARELYSCSTPEINHFVTKGVLYVRGDDESGHYDTSVAAFKHDKFNLVSEVTELVKEFHNKYGYKISVLEIPLCSLLNGGL